MLGRKNHKNFKMIPTYNLLTTPFVYNGFFLDIRTVEENAELTELIAETEKVSFRNASCGFPTTSVFDNIIFCLFICFCCWFLYSIDYFSLAIQLSASYFHLLYRQAISRFEKTVE